MNASPIITGLTPRWAVMWLLAGSLFMLGKAAVLFRIKSTGAPWSMWKTLAWFCTWPGMNLRDFERSGQVAKPRSECPRSPVLALTKILLGSFLLWGAARYFSHPLAAGWCGMIGLILLLHFGVFDLLALFWQSRGYRAVPIMKAPITSLSVAEFWGRRWNSAFRDLAHPFLFIPAARSWGNVAALWLSFAISGLAHELVISVPAGAGFGLPTVYFLTQALGISLEKRAFPKDAARRASPVSCWLFTHAFTALPAFILFHPPFVERVMLPFFHSIGALP
ncbi:MAG: membrane bound O-acyl transferase family-domain-containing protein [Verrucomicrobia bacterium]|nr:membrane bound O-acyl transferase family-domain-containing protein [Verrucomicrobiota bacterium]